MTQAIAQLQITEQLFNHLCVYKVYSLSLFTMLNLLIDLSSDLNVSGDQMLDLLIELCVKSHILLVSRKGQATSQGRITRESTDTIYP